MALTKTLETLLDRAERKGEAIKRVRECNIMHSYSSSREFVEQWRVVHSKVTNEDGTTSEYYKVFHYETLIFHADYIYPTGWSLTYWYGEGNADRDALNGLCAHFGIRASFRYLPSKVLFERTV